MVKKICVLLCLMFAVAAGTVFAHSVLVSSQPKDGAIVKDPVSELKLTFNTKIEKVLSLKIREPQNGNEMSLKATSHGKVVEATLQNPLKKGSYEVHYRVIGEDGHAVEGEYAFIVKNSTEEQTNHASPKDKSQDSSTGKSSVDQNDRDDQAEGTLPNDNHSDAVDGSGGNPLMIGIVIALAIVVIITLVVLLKKRN